MARALPALLFCALGLCPAAQAQFAISQLPFQVTPAPPANIVLTIDDSGSMQNAYVPDSVGDAYSTSLGFSSSDYNRLYYNPAIQYLIPPNAAGLPASSPTFGAAYIDGFNTAAGSVNLASAYQPTLQYSPGSTTQNFAKPAVASGTAAYYYVFNAAAGCAAPVPWLAPPADSCFTQVIVGATSGPGLTDETQNFANWYSFYRTRHLAIASSAAIAMSDPGLSAARVAWQGLTSCADFTSGRCQGWDNTVPAVDNRIRSFIGQHRTDFFSWLYRVPAQNSTPTRQAWWRTGEYFRTKGPNSPYGVDPNNGSTSTIELACVSNFQITMTDGQWNTNDEKQTNFCGSSVCPNVDGLSQTFPDGTAYSPSPALAASTSIYSDYNVGGLADIAFYYWATNLRPDLTGTGASFQPAVPAYTTDTSTLNPATGRTDPGWPYWNPRNDPATWPHLVNFTIGVGLTGYLTLPGLLWTQDSFGGNPPGALALVNGSNGYSDLLRVDPSACLTPAGSTAQVPYPNRCNWPWINPNGTGGVSAPGGTGGGNGQGNNGNGQGNGGPAGGNAGNVYDLWHGAIDSRGQAFSAESPLDLVNALRLIVGRIEGQMRGNSGVSGSSSSLSTSSMLFVGSYDASDWHGVLSAFTIQGPASANPGSINPTPAWQTTASGAIPAYSARNVVTAGAIVPLGGQVPAGTSGTSFSAANQAALASAGIWPWLGSASIVNYLLGDASNEVPAGLKYRARSVTKLGDIVDSSPLYAGADDFGYAAFSGSAAFPEAGSYAAFLSGKTSRPAMVYIGANDGMLHGFDALTGVERFAYVPHSAIPGVAALASPNYAHSFFVDGPAFAGDAFISTGGGASWHTILVGTTGAGGKGVFALDVSDPAGFGAASLLWDMDGTAVPPGGTTAWGNSDPDLGSTIGQPIIGRMNDGNWYAIFGNGYLSTRACPVLYLVRLDTGAATRIDAQGLAGAACTAANGTGPNGLGSPTLFDADNNGTMDFIYAGDLLGNLWKFDVRSSSPSGWTVAFGSGRPLFTATTPAGLAQPIVAAPNIGPGAAGPMIYFSTGHSFAVGDAADTTAQGVYGVSDTGRALGSRLTLGARILAQTVTPAADGSGNETVSQNPVSIPAANDGWVIDLPGAGERSTQTPVLAGGVLLFTSIRAGGSACTGGGCTSFLYAVSPGSGAGGLGFLHSGTSVYDALVSGVGCIEGLTTVTNKNSLYVYWVGSQPPGTTPPGSTPPPPPPPGTPPPVPPPLPPPICPDPFGCTSGPMIGTGRISWQEMVP